MAGWLGLQQRGSRFVVRYRAGRETYWTATTGTDCQLKAEAVLQAWQAELQKAQTLAKIGLAEFCQSTWKPQALVDFAQKQKQQGQPLQAAVREYVRELERLHKSNKRTMAAETSRALKVGLALQESCRFTGQLDYAAARGCLAAWNEAELAPKTQAELLRVAKGMADFWQAMGWTEKNPFREKGIKPPKQSTEPRPFWTVREIEQIIKQAPGQFKLLFSLMAYAGLRVSEAVKLNWMDIDLDGLGLVVRNGKGGKTARVPISPRLARRLKQAAKRKQFGRVCDRVPESLQAIATQLQKAAAGLEWEQGGKPHCHRFRHSFASNLARAGTDLVRIKELMRHSDIKQTARYSHLMGQDTAAALQIF